MVTALVLQLIQCVVNLPQSAPTVVDGMPAEEEAAEASRHSKADKSGKGKRRSAEVVSTSFKQGFDSSCF
ncbi:hypothetical protein DPMN_105080 [Dreissena polymorpha]|uniref:Uncharacterized protein n=1 Tax=Dreissena polymorpha TaxID=45954 RepID=A0A9D4HE81_DREPO|nr:hypothetical protein DPMN_105080 [Dreissena polymorpha]